MKVWVTRDSDDGDEIMNSSISIRLHQPTPWPQKEGMWMLTPDSSSCDLFIAKPMFNVLFGFTPRKGSSEQRELSLEEIK